MSDIFEVGMKDEQGRLYRCPACGETPFSNTMDLHESARWRFNGKRWEHHHGYPVGHIETVATDDTASSTDKHSEEPAP